MSLDGLPGSGWNTWDARWPASVSHPGAGAVLRIGAYSTSGNRFTDFPWSPRHELGRHDLDGGEIAVQLRHAGSTLHLRLAAAGAGAIAGELACAEMAEWGLRFWLLLEFGASGAGPPATRLIMPPGGAYTEPPAAVLEPGDGGLAAAFSALQRPADARLTLERGALGTVMENQGYYARPQPPRRGRYAVFRFTAAEPSVVFAAAVGPDGQGAADRVRRALAAPIRPADPAGRGGSRRRGGTGGSAAIRDVLGWNTIWDPVNRRVYTASTRAWIEPKFGGFGVWQIDGFLHAVLAAHLGAGWLAWRNIDAVLAGRTEHGNLPALAAGSTCWADRSHPPVGAHACWSVQAMTPDPAAAGQAAAVLAEAFGWWFRARDGNRNGLLEYGSSPVGDGHFVHTRQAAMDESANDNSPVHDDARFDQAVHTLDVEDVGLNSLLAHEGTMLAMLLRASGRDAEADRAAGRAAGLTEAVRARLWDERREVFAGRHWSGEFTRSLSPTSFYPLLAGIATRAQAEAMVERWLKDPRRFGGPYPVAGTPHEDPAAADNVYWRGRVWPCFNYLVYLGLRRYRFDAEAAWLAGRGTELFAAGWAERRCYENFSQRTGEGGDSADSDPFYTWGALLPMLADLELISIDPWDGLCFGAAGSAHASARAFIGGQEHAVEVGPDSTTVSVDGTVIVAANLRGRFRRLQAGPQRLSLELPPAPREATVEVTLAGTAISATLDGDVLAPDRLGPPRQAGAAAVHPVRVPGSPRPRQIEITGAAERH